MCGIAGLVAPESERVSRAALVRMTETLRHRGPDANGFFVDGAVGLGHRRLSIIDTSEAANQPLFNEDGTITVVFNGEIYNFRELGRELEVGGHRLRNRSDAEVVGHAWEEYGIECLQHFRGMFAFALYDARRAQLFLARDRLGKKPLYYLSHSSGFAFASEIKALRTLPAFSEDIDVQALGEYAAYGNTLGERSIYRSIRRLPPAHYLTLALHGSEGLLPKIRRYWDVEVEPDGSASEEEWLERLDGALSEAVRRRLVSDVPLGAFLSGGIDSSLVVAYMSRQSDEPVKTFTMGFGEPSHDESSWARAVAGHFGTRHHEKRLEPDAVGVLDRLVEVYDEPFADESAIPMFYLSEMAREQVTVALSGDGGDEGFLGYLRYPTSAVTVGVSQLLTPLGRKLLREISTRLPMSAIAKRYLDRVSQRGFDVYHHAMGYSDEMLDILHSDVRQRLAGPAQGKMARDFGRFQEAPLVERFAQVDLRNYLPDDVLVKVDRASMHHSLEVRCPLLDDEVIELAARIPTHLKLRGMTGKRILRKLLARFLPAELINRPKRGFGVPLKRWFRWELKSQLEQMCTDSSSAAWSYLDHAAVEQRTRYHQIGRADLHVSLWRALCFYRWIETRKL